MPDVPFSGVSGYAAAGQYRLHLDVTEGTVDIPNNRSYVSWTEYVVKQYGSGYNSGYGGSPWAVSGGVGGSGSWGPYNFAGYTTLVLGSGGAWITHDSDGTKTISGGFSASDSADPTIGSASGSWSLTLTAIARGALDRFNGSTWPMNMLDRRSGADYTLETLERFNGSGWVRQI